MTDEGVPAGPIVLNETIHQPTRLRIMTMIVSVPETDRLAYGFIQQTLGLTGGNLTTHLRKLHDAGYLDTTKEFIDAKPRTWVQATLERTSGVRRVPVQPRAGAQLASTRLASGELIRGAPVVRPPRRTARGRATPRGRRRWRR